MDEVFWLNDPSILIKNYYDIYPTKKNFFNALIRFFIIGAIIFLLFKRYNWLYLCIVAIILLTIFGYMYDNKKDNQNKINYIKNYTSCRRSSINNPMSNLLITAEDINLEACDEEKDIIDKNLYYNFLEDENDMHAKKKLRAFITMPITSVPNDRSKFLDYVFDKNLAPCKTDGIECEKFRDIRYNK
jgi:hypothetical protein